MQLSPIMKGARTFLLVRHGQTKANKERRLQGRSIDFGLTDEGRQQANRFAHFLQHAPHLTPDVIIASPLIRAQETAQIIAQAVFTHQDAYIVHDDLVEIDFGNLQNLSLRSLEADSVRAKDLYAGLDIDISYPSGESIREAQARMVKAFLAIKAKYVGQNPLIVSHGGVLRLLIASVLRTEHIQPIYHNNTGLTILDELDGRLAIRTMNSTAHLSPLYD